MNRLRMLSWALQGLVALILAPMAIAKFTSDSQAVAVFTEIGMEPAGRYVIGALELVVVVLLLLPSSVAWGAILGWGVMTGALIAHATVLGMGDPLPSLGIPLGVMAIVNWMGCAAIVILRRREIEFIRNMSPEEEEEASADRP